MQESPKVCVVLLNYNGWTDTVDCLQSLRQLQYPNVQIIVVDNASADDSVEQLRTWLTENGAAGVAVRANSMVNEGRGQSTVRESQFQWADGRQAGDENNQAWPLVLLESDANLGFAAGNNLGIRYGLSGADAEFIWLLNNDTVVDRLALGELVSTFVKKDSEEKPLAMCGSLILDFDNRDQLQAFGGGMVNRYLGTTHSLLAGKKAQSDAVANAQVLPDYISGCSLLIKTQRIAATGLLNENYFLYWEDTEWSFRCKRQGMGLAVAKLSKVWHRRGSTSGRFPIIAFYNTRNCLWFFREYLRAWLPLCLLFRPLYFSAVALKHLNYPFFRESVRGYLEFFAASDGN